MSDTLVAVLVSPLAYLLGTFPSAELVARRQGVDILEEGSRNPGASNTFRLLGWKAGAVVFVMDALKGAIAAGVGLAIDGHTGGFILGFAALLGHVLPVTRHFRGGRGVATTAGMLLVLFPLLAPALAVLWIVIAKLTHKASLASLLVAVAAPGLVALAGHPLRDVVLIGVLSLVVIVRHFANLRRLVRGEELGLGSGNVSDGDAPAPG